MSTTDVELKDPPCDGITKLAFTKATHSADTGCLLASSWDSNIYCYDVRRNKSLVKINTGSPLLSCLGDFSDQNVMYSADLDGALKRYTIDRSDVIQVGRHQEAVSALTNAAAHNLLISGSWDKSVCGWDRNTCQQTFCSRLDKKIYSLDCAGDYVVVGAADRNIYIFDLRKPGIPVQKRESSLRYQTRSVACSTDGNSFVCTSIEGRVSVDRIDPSPEEQSKKYAFKCHRAPIADQVSMELVYPVHCAAFHSNGEIFATGGGDGFVNLWDINAKKRLKQFGKYPSSISSIAFSRESSIIAIASSYCFEEGEKE